MTQLDRSTRPAPTPPGAPPARGLTAHPAAFWLVLLAAFALWVVAIARTNSEGLGDWGLLPAFPVIWYVAVAVVFLLVVLAIAARPVVDGRTGAALGVLVLILRASPGLVEEAPRLPWVYKHIAVTRYVETYGSIDPSLDIYHKWPGFFTLTAFLHDAGGYDSPIAYAASAEVVFSLLDVLLVLAIARTISRNPAWYWTAALVFAIGDWVGQNYFAPQAFGLVLHLAITLVFLTFFRHAPNGLGLRLESLVRRLTRARRDAPDEGWRSTAELRQRYAAMALILVITVVLVVSHQLTPYLALLALVPLFLLRYLRSAPIVAAMVLLTLAYLYPNIEYIQERFGQLAHFDPVGNVTYTAPDPAIGSVATEWRGRATNALSAVIIVLGLWGLLRRVRSGHVRSAVVVGWFAVSPVLTLLGQTYGGEGKFRVYLFALPWFAMGVAWLFTGDGPASPGRLRAAARAVALTVMAGLFVLAYYQPEADYRLAPSDVAAGEWVDEHVEPGDHVLFGTRNFPIAIGPRYHVIPPWNAGVLTEIRDCQGGSPLRVGRLKDLMRVRNVPEHATFVVFTDSAEEYTTRHGVVPAGELDALEATLSRDADVERVLDTGEARVYRFDNADLGSAAGGTVPASVADCVFN